MRSTILEASQNDIRELLGIRRLAWYVADKSSIIGAAQESIEMHADQASQVVQPLHRDTSRVGT